MLDPLFLLLCFSLTLVLAFEHNHLNELAAINNNLGYKSYLLIKYENENIFYSPLSTLISLSMLYAGAKEDTLEQIKNVLNYNHTAILDIHTDMREYLISLKKIKFDFIFEISYGMFVDKSINLLLPYIRTLKTHYMTTPRQIEFQLKKHTLEDLINSWASATTHNKVKTILDKRIHPKTDILLVNIMYLEGKWGDFFDHYETKKGIFYNYGKKTNKLACQMMETDSKMGFIDGENFKAVNLKTKKSDVSMMVVVPNEGEKIENIQNFLTPEILDTYLRHMKQKKVFVKIPKFSLEFNKNLRETLSLLGLTSLFKSGANLSGMSKQLRKVIIKNFIFEAVFRFTNDQKNDKVNGAKTKNKSKKITSSKEKIVADRPFLFYIVDTRYNLVIFIGRVEQLRHPNKHKP